MEGLLEQIEELPPLPAVASRVMALADNDRTSALDLAQVLSTDQALTAKLIKVSNSAYYGFARRVSTVREAVLVLGFRQVRQMAVGASIMNAFMSGARAGGFDLDLFWGHSVAVAVAAETYARKSRVCKPEDAFTAGILHDIGRLVLLRARPAEFGQAVALARSGECSLHEAEARLLGLSHDHVGRVLGERWKFPGHLVEAIGMHHDNGLRPEDGLPGVVAQCNELVLHHGLFCGYDAEGELAPLPPLLAELEETCGGIDTLLQRAFAFIETASGTPEHWYARAA
ncbi:MAG: HDOD domain-containing protein [Gemmataceae bacterium]|nr:HDOD domain-containing protein [Gemmataceae bacterium]